MTASNPETLPAEPTRESPFRTPLLLTLVLGAAATRLVPHPDNFAPVAALALFGAATFRRPWQAFAVPFSAMLLSDVGLQFLYNAGLSRSQGFYSGQWLIYLTFAAFVGIGFTLRGRTSTPSVVVASLTSSLLFFLVTNFGVWFGSSFYPQNLAGLMTCYAAGLPFLWKTVAGDLFFSAVLFGGFALLTSRVPALRAVPAH